MDLTELKARLRDTAAFSLLSDEELEQCIGRLEVIRYRLGQIVYSQRDEAEALYIVHSGRARLVAEDGRGQEVTLETFARGEHFGEHELLAARRRQHTVRAAEDLTVLRLQVLPANPALREYLERCSEQASQRYFLKLSTDFSRLSLAEIRELSGRLRARECAAGQMIVRAGEAADGFYLLRSGSAKVIDEHQGEAVLRRLVPGNSFGEAALLDGKSHAWSVVADEPSVVLFLSKGDLEHFLSAAPESKVALVPAASAGEIIDAPEPPPSPSITQPLLTAPERQQPGGGGWRRFLRQRRYPALLQTSEMDCGPACLAMVLRHYNKHISINRLRDLANVSREGSSLYDVATAIETLGFRARAIRAAYEHLGKIQLPAIAHWEGYHFVVLYEVGPDRVVVADPAVGLRRLTREEFTKGWTGYMLVMAPTPDLTNVEESKTTFRRFFPLLKPYRKLLAEIFLAALIIQLFGLATPVFMQVIVDKVLVHKSSSMLNLMLVGMLLVAVFQTATVALRHYLTVHTTRRIDLEMVVAFYRHVLSLPLLFFENRRVGDILKRFGENEKIRELLTGRALGVLLDCIMIVVYLGLMLYYNAKLALVALAFIPGYSALTLIITPVMKRQHREAFERSAEAESHMIESVTAVGTVKATASERGIRWQWEALMVRALNIEFRSALTSVSASAVGNVLQTLNTTVLFWYGTHLVISGELSTGQLMAFTALLGNVTRPILSLIDLWHDFQEVNVALERLNDVFDAKPEEDLAQQSLIQLPPLRGHIKFENVTFRYPGRGERNALENINLEVLPGQTVALVGRSGAGKTTFANLLLRLHAPSEGRILLDGYDLRQVSLASLRAQVGVVPQDVFLFSGTIRDNIAFGHMDAPLAEVVGAAMLAGAHEFISQLPLGYETKIGERGQSLSGGQRQRIAIARALFRRPGMLVFDEATSALDAESERAIQQNFEDQFQERTTLVIAHRLSTVRSADLIVVLDQGVIVEHGTHESLMEQHGLYYYLCRQQLEG